MNQSKLLRFCVGFLLVVLTAKANAGSKVYPAPAGVDLSSDFTVAVDGQSSPVYIARVGPADQKRLYQAMDDYKLSDSLYDIAGFTQFDVDGSAAVVVSFSKDVTSAKVLPTAAGITPIIAGKTITFTVKSPSNLVLEVNGDTCHSLHLFANPVETNIPREGDPDVIFFGPGVHDVPAAGIDVGSGKTLYLAGGAIVRATEGGKPVVQLHGEHVTLRGRGILDCSLATVHSRSLVVAKETSDLLIEGIVLHDSAGWSMPIRNTDRTTIRNVKIFSHRANGDGIDLCNCRDTLVEGCFLRTLDDCIVVKADKGQGPVSRVLVQKCVLWNQVAHALSIGAELREPIDDVHFTDCDVIHDTGREWTLRIYNCDSANVTHTRFDHIRIEESRRLISVWIGKAQWSKEADRGHVNDVLFSDITAAGKPLTVDMVGFDADHIVDGVKFENVTLNGQPLRQAEVKENKHVQNVTVTP